MSLEKLDKKISALENLLFTIYHHLIPEWQRALDAQHLATSMAKKNRTTAKALRHHKVAGQLIVSSGINKNKRNLVKTRAPLVPRNTPERANKEAWTKLRSEVSISIAKFEKKLLEVARTRATQQLENLKF